MVVGAAVVGATVVGAAVVGAAVVGAAVVGSAFSLAVAVNFAPERVFASQFVRSSLSVRSNVALVDA